MEHTANYQLSQWAMTDRIQMEDFNSDNAKIDAALKALDTTVKAKANQSVLNTLQNTVNNLAAKVRSELILDHTFTEAAALFTADLSQVDWSQYSVILSYVAPTSGGRYYTPFGNSTETSTTVEVLFPMHSADTQVIGFRVVSSTAYHHIENSRTFREITKYQLKNPYDVFGVGTVARVIGIR